MCSKGKNMVKKGKEPNKIWLILLIAIIGVASVGYTIYVDIYLANRVEDIFTDVYLDKQIKVATTPSPRPTVANTPSPSPTSTPTLQPTATPLPEVAEHIQQYLNGNDQTVGYIKIEDTPIDYPVLYSGDNDFYLHNDFNQQPSYTGAVFLDHRCNVYDMESTRNVILYGHNNRDGTMFNGLVHYFGEDFFNEHRIITFDTLAGEMQWEVFAVFETHVEFYYINTLFPTDKDWFNFITYCQSLSVHETDVVLQRDDIVLTLSTCAVGDDYRNVIMARLIK